MQYLSFIVLLSLFLSSCSGDVEQEEVPPVEVAAPVIVLEPGCTSCHDKKLDAAHDIGCIRCHKGDNNSAEKQQAHRGMLSQPAHPDTMEEICGSCHQQQVSDTAHSSHFTVKNEVNRVRMAFGAKTELASLLDIPVQTDPKTVLQLADDLLRRRCLRCHPYYTGDRYPAVVRGAGCASCHLEFYKGKLVSHSFLRTPGDSQCLQCHYGNWVGYDYYGRYEHDLNDEYRTPYTTRYDYFRPFGVEFHQLTPDIHQQKGMVCVDCHGGSELMRRQETKILCSSCHRPEGVKPDQSIANISENEDGVYTLLSAGDGLPHVIPALKHPAHKKYNDRVACLVCHAQWSFGDNGTHLLRSDLEEYDDFIKLSVQGSFEVEQIIKNNLDYDADELPHVMTDKISGRDGMGLWYKGYGTRRWEDVTIGRDDSGRLQVMRPLLKISLSWIDEDEEVRFDSVPSHAENNGWLPYVPHTTGRAGLFYKDRIKLLLKTEDSGDK
jgi:hypothetical protein